MHGKIIIRDTLCDCGLDLSGPVVGSCEHGNEPSGCIRGRELLEELSDY
jgi:hypothetical protein